MSKRPPMLWTECQALALRKAAAQTFSARETGMAWQTVPALYEANLNEQFQAFFGWCQPDGEYFSALDHAERALLLCFAAAAAETGDL